MPPVNNWSARSHLRNLFATGRAPWAFGAHPDQHATLINAASIGGHFVKHIRNEFHATKLSLWRRPGFRRTTHHSVRPGLLAGFRTNQRLVGFCADQCARNRFSAPTALGASI
jgi:hypothetical protein